MSDNININNVSLQDIQDLLSRLGSMAANQPQPDNQPQPTTAHEISEVVTDWIHYLETDNAVKEKTNSTLRVYESHVRNFAKWSDSASVEEVSKVEIVAYRTHLESIGRKPATTNTILTVLNRFFDYCVESNYCPKNPARSVSKIESDQLQPKSLDDFTLTQFRNCIKLSCKTRNNPTQLLMFDFMLNMGLRISEVVALQFRDINLDTRTLTVRMSKRNRTRKLGIPQSLLESYKRFKSRYQERSKNPNNFVFTHKGEAYTPSAVRIYYERLCNKHEIPHVTPHMLRHSFCVRKINSNVNPTLVQGLMGHADFSTTARYAMPSMQDKLDSAEKGVFPCD